MLNKQRLLNNRVPTTTSAVHYQSDSMAVLRGADLEAAHSLDIPNSEDHRQQRVEALVDNAHAVHKLGWPLAVAAVAVLEGDGTDRTGYGVQDHEGNENGQLLIVLEDHGGRKQDGAHQLTSACRHACHRHAKCFIKHIAWEGAYD